MTVCAAVCCSVLQCVAVCCSVLLCVAVCYIVLQCVAVCCSVLQCVAVCYSDDDYKHATHVMIITNTTTKRSLLQIYLDCVFKNEYICVYM